MLSELNNLFAQDKSILFAGVGNLLKCDDGVGVYISDRIVNGGRISSISAEVSIENYIGKINSLDPDLLVIVDCADMGLPPGSYRLIEINETEDITFNTHNISLSRLTEFFRMPVIILGIQPERIDFGENISYLVKNVADKLINLINFTGGS